jgi:DNA invertase Pin-like site-specific DNA recombinase
MVEQRSWSVVRVYSDRMSGASDHRPGLRALMQGARRGAFDVVVVWRFDRFARSIEQLVLALAEFRTLGIDFVSSQEALDTSTPMGKAMFTIIGTMAELERNVIRERIVAGLEHAKTHGTKSGAAIGRPRVVFDRVRVVELRDAGRSWRQIAAELSVSVATVRRVYEQGVPKPFARETAMAELNELSVPEYLCRNHLFLTRSETPSLPTLVISAVETHAESNRHWPRPRIGRST